MKAIENNLNLIDVISDILMVLLYLSFIILSSDSNGVYVMIGLTSCIFLIDLLRNTKPINLHLGVFHLYIFNFALFSLISSLWAINSSFAIEKGITLLELLVCFTLLYKVYYYAKIERLLKIIMWAGFLLSVYTIFFVGLDSIRNTMTEDGRLENSFANINSIGMTCSTSILICLFFFRREKNLYELFFCIPCVVIVASSGSRKALFMLIIGLIYIFFNLGSSHNNSRNSKKLLSSIFIILSIFFIIFESGIFSGALNRFDGLIASFTGEGHIDSSTRIRMYFREIGFMQLKETPFLGIGMGNARILANDLIGMDVYLHCNYAELAANGGILGLLIYYWIYFYIIRVEIKKTGYDKLASIILLLVVLKLITDYGAVSYYSKSTYFLLMVAMLHIRRFKTYKNIKYA